MPRFLREMPTISIFCVALLIAGFYASWIKLWGDQNWFARSGGIVVFIVGSIVVVAVRKRYREIDKGIDLLRKHYHGSFERVAELIYGVEEIGRIKKNIEDGEHDEGITPDALADAVSHLSKDRIQRYEIFWLGAGTLVWTLGDLIQFWPRG